MTVVIAMVVVILTIAYVVYAVQQLKLRGRYAGTLINTLQTKPPKPSRIFIGPASFEPVRSDMESQPWRREGYLALDEDNGFDLAGFRKWRIARAMDRAHRLSSQLAAIAKSTGTGFFKNTAHDVLLHVVRLDRPQLLNLYTAFVNRSSDGEVNKRTFTDIIEAIAEVSRKRNRACRLQTVAAPGSPHVRSAYAALACWPPD